MEQEKHKPISLVNVNAKNSKPHKSKTKQLVTMTVHHDHIWLNPGIQSLRNIQKHQQCNPPHKLITLIHGINRKE